MAYGNIIVSLAYIILYTIFGDVFTQSSANKPQKSVRAHKTDGSNNKNDDDDDDVGVSGPKLNKHIPGIQCIIAINVC